MFHLCSGNGGQLHSHVVCASRSKPTIPCWSSEFQWPLLPRRQFSEFDLNDVNVKRNASISPWFDHTLSLHAYWFFVIGTVQDWGRSPRRSANRPLTPYSSEVLLCTEIKCFIVSVQLLRSPTEPVFYWSPLKLSGSYPAFVMLTFPPFALISLNSVFTYLTFFFYHCVIDSSSVSWPVTRCSFSFVIWLFCATASVMYPRRQSTLWNHNCFVLICTWNRWWIPFKYLALSWANRTTAYASPCLKINEIMQPAIQS